MTAGVTFAVTAVRVEPFAAVPTLVFDLRITAGPDEPVDAILLRCQIRIEPDRRGYRPAEQNRLVELFGTPERWRDTARPFLWTHVTTVVPSFRGELAHEMPVECSYELEAGPARYLHAVRDGEVPLRFLFSGSVFAAGPNGMWVRQIPWDREATFRMPATTWHNLMDQYHPGTGWLRLRRETIDALAAYKAQAAHPTWDAAVEALVTGPVAGRDGHRPGVGPVEEAHP